MVWWSIVWRGGFVQVIKHANYAEEIVGLYYFVDDARRDFPQANDFAV